MVGGRGLISWFQLCKTIKVVLNMHTTLMGHTGQILIGLGCHNGVVRTLISCVANFNWPFVSIRC